MKEWLHDNERLSALLALCGRGGGGESTGQLWYNTHKGPFMQNFDD